MNLLTNRFTLLKTVINVDLKTNLHLVDCSGEGGLLNVNESVFGGEMTAQLTLIPVLPGRAEPPCKGMIFLFLITLHKKELKI